ncbi:hypothetical protein Pan216_56050 [Planctomycetes bacterium Pan216]|uniref:Glycosyltransferase RgtA/B/C/D-like domain-containing protein n=1 Tax=Kolteria novifilia TaxID=2527975 RepID=A0A518BCL0_9BACT|nr:hypothetical protein Pan216_56050 [Planctomycetes bacterium Pan216]
MSILRHQSFAAAGLVGFVGFLLVIATLGEPGLTIDEPINAHHGKLIVSTLTAPGGTLAERVWFIWKSAHDHPPLTRLALGLANGLTDPSPRDTRFVDPFQSRWASALMYGLLLFLVTRFAWSLRGPAAGWSAGIATLLMPRLFGQAHFASPEVISAAFYLAALVSIGWAIGPLAVEEQAGTKRCWWRCVLAGGVLGLALLTKLTCILLPASVGIAALAVLRWRALLPLVIWGATGLLVVFVAWPWLWPFNFPGYPSGLAGSLARVVEFLRVAFDRATVYVWYGGRQFPHPKSAVPWHFVWTYFLVTVPIGLQLLGLGLGLPRAIRMMGRTPAASANGERLGAALVLSAWLLPLLVFTLPIERYDGERLFLFIFPLWGIIIGLGAADLVAWLRPRLGLKWAASLMVLLALSQAYGIVHDRPYWLSYYNLAVGGLRGAERLGLETTYWGDSLTPAFLNKVAATMPEEACAILVPTLHDGHAVALPNHAMRQSKQNVVPAHLGAANGCGWAILFRRDGYLIDPIPHWVMEHGTLEAESSLDGVWLSRLYRLPPEPLPGRRAP